VGVTKIEWTAYRKPDGSIVSGYTFNPWLGCSKVSSACANCYAEAWAKRSGLVRWGGGAERRRTSDEYWGQPRKWNKAAEKAGERRRVFCASLADVFEDRPELVEWREELFEIIHRTPNLDWLLLTKRPENILRLWPFGWIKPGSDLYPNLWFGTTVENQEQADRRIPELLEVPAHVRFLSCEPLLGHIAIEDYLPRYGCGRRCHHSNNKADLCREGGIIEFPAIDWVIVGGESGTNARPMHPDWARSLRDQFVSAGVPFFFKQWGEWWPSNYEPKSSEWIAASRASTAGMSLTYNGDTASMFKVGKKAAGRLLDGREWNEFPKLAAEMDAA
jgi:protein gp37